MLRILALIGVMYSAVTGAADYSSFYIEGDDTETSAQDVISDKVEQKRVLVWVGRVMDVSIYTNKDGATSIEWFCEQHPFERPMATPLAEPFRVAANPTGNFVVTLSLPTLSIDGAREKIVNQLESPSWVLVRGEAEFVRKYKGMNAVYLHSLNASISDTMRVELGDR